MRFWTPRDFTERPKLTMLVASYLGDEPRRFHTLRCLLASFSSQTYPNWEAVVVHDGPMQSWYREKLGECDSRVRIEETPAKIGHFGHKYRHRYACGVTEGWIGFTNDDNYYAPTYFEWMLAEGIAKKAEFVFCDMVHSHKQWRPFPTQPRYKKLDLGGFIAKKELVHRTPWTDFSFKGDGTYINALVANAKKTHKVGATLFVHN